METSSNSIYLRGLPTQARDVILGASTWYTYVVHLCGTPMWYTYVVQVVQVHLPDIQTSVCSAQCNSKMAARLSCLKRSAIWLEGSFDQGFQQDGLKALLTKEVSKVDRRVSCLKRSRLSTLHEWSNDILTVPI